MAQGTYWASQPAKEVGALMDALRRQFPILSSRFHVRDLAIFGSYVHGRQQEGSDLDILVDFDETPSLLEFLDLEHYLSDLLGLKVDLVMKSALKHRIGRRIIQEMIPI